MDPFSKATSDHINSLKLEDRKKLGQYMTPQFLGRKMAAMMTVSPHHPIKVLDPAIGTGELVLAFEGVHPHALAEYHGWDIDRDMLGVFAQNVPGAKSQQRGLFEPIAPDLLGSFDKIIGNPPYFELKKDNPDIKGLDFETKNERGRLNIYALFFEYALKLLKVGGEMVYLVPPSMNNGAYFALTRNHILENAYIANLEIIKDEGHFVDAQTATQIIHLVKTDDGYEKNLERSKQFVIDFNQITKTPKDKKLPVIFSADKSGIEKAWRGRKSLYELGFTVSTGKTVWNQHKGEFAKESKKTAPLLYAKDIGSDNKLTLNPRLNERRHLPLNTKGRESAPCIIVNRIVGAVTNPSLRYAKVDLKQYFTENHVNVIKPLPTASLTVKELAERLKINQKWLSDYLKALTGNTQISGTELQYLIPF